MRLMHVPELVTQIVVISLVTLGVHQLVGAQWHTPMDCEMAGCEWPRMGPETKEPAVKDKVQNAGYDPLESHIFWIEPGDEDVAGVVIDSSIADYLRWQDAGGLPPGPEDYYDDRDPEVIGGYTWLPSPAPGDWYENEIPGGTNMFANSWVDVAVSRCSGPCDEVQGQNQYHPDFCWKEIECQISVQRLSITNDYLDEPAHPIDPPPNPQEVQYWPLLEFPNSHDIRIWKVEGPPYTFEDESVECVWCEGP